MKTTIHIMGQLKWNLKSNIYINCSKEINDKDAKFEIAEIVRMTEYKKDYTPN